MTIHNIMNDGHVPVDGFVNADSSVGFTYGDKNDWIYCGSSGWTKAEKYIVGYDTSFKRAWNIHDRKTLYSQKGGELYHGDTFTLENRHHDGESMYLYGNKHIGCSDYGLNDVYMICKFDLMDNPNGKWVC